MPLIVGSPVSLNSPSFFGSIRVLLNMIVGYLSSSRKYGERRSLSRWALLVVRLATMLTSTDESAGRTGSTWPRVVTALKYPRTVIIPKYLARNSTCVCIGSTCHVVRCVSLGRWSGSPRRMHGRKRCLDHSWPEGPSP